VLRIYTDLAVCGIIPNEREWPKAQTATASGSKSE
jgi:hypothetical protein